MDSVLYYPHVSPPVDWLRRAVLCWDRVIRLRPTEADPDPETLLEFDRAMGGGIIGSENFAALVEDGPTQLDFAFWVDENVDRLSRELEAPDRQVAWIYNAKLGLMLREILWRRGLIERDRDHPSRVIVPSRLALKYLSYCAGVVARDRHYDLVTDELVFSEPALFDGQFHYSLVRAKVASTVLELRLPDNLLALPLERLAEIRGSLASQRLAYHVEIRDLVSDLVDVSSERDLQVIAAKAVELAKQRLDETERAYRAAKLAVAKDTILVALSPPGVAAWLSSALGIGLIAPTGVGVALGLFGAATLTSLQKARDAADSGPFSYVRQVERAVRAS